MPALAVVVALMWPAGGRAQVADPASAPAAPVVSVLSGADVRLADACLDVWPPGLPAGVAPSGAAEPGPALGSDELEAYWAGLDSAEAPVAGSGTGGALLLVSGHNGFAYDLAGEREVFLPDSQAYLIARCVEGVRAPGAFNSP